MANFCIFFRLIFFFVVFLSDLVHDVDCGDYALHSLLTANSIWKSLLEYE